jgi:preprotein translocase subunit SecG
MILVVGLAIFVSILLVLVVLSQSSKGGISANFIGAGASQMMGVKRTSDLLEKLTWGFAIALVVLTLSSNFFIPRPVDDTEAESINVERANQSVVPPVGSPAGGANDGGLLPEEEGGDLSPESNPEEE